MNSSSAEFSEELAESGYTLQQIKDAATTLTGFNGSGKSINNCLISRQKYNSSKK
jgi:hypothetical protein